MRKPLLWTAFIAVIFLFVEVGFMWLGANVASQIYCGTEIDYWTIVQLSNFAEQGLLFSPLVLIAILIYSLRRKLLLLIPTLIIAFVATGVSVISLLGLFVILKHIDTVTIQGATYQLLDYSNESTKGSFVLCSDADASSRYRCRPVWFYGGPTRAQLQIASTQDKVLVLVDGRIAYEAGKDGSKCMGSNSNCDRC